MALAHQQPRNFSTEPHAHCRTLPYRFCRRMSYRKCALLDVCTGQTAIHQGSLKNRTITPLDGQIPFRMPLLLPMVVPQAELGGHS